MKTIALLLTLLLFSGMTMFAYAPEKLVLKAGQQRTMKQSRLKIKFISVIEDSRCPVDVQCVWAGNAKVKVQISGAHSTKVFEFNTGAGPQGDILEGWAIYLDELTPQRKGTAEIRPAAYRATFRVERLQR